MALVWIRGCVLFVLSACLALAQAPADVSQGAVLQALLKEVHALRVAMEESNKIGPRIQVALARMQLEEERVRNAARQLQEARDRLADVQTKRAENEDVMKRFEAHQADTTDPNLRKQMEADLAGLKAAGERLSAQEQQLQAKEADANSQLTAEQGRWGEANDALKSIERALAPAQ